MDTVLSDLLAQWGGFKKAEDYHAFYIKMLGSLSTLRAQASALKIITLEDYSSGMKLFDVLNSLICYVWNHKDDKNEPEVSAIYRIAWNKLYKFCKSYRKLSGPVLKLAYYLAYSRAWNLDDPQARKILSRVQDHIFIDDHGVYWITGFHLATGDNTFTVSRRTGQQYRNYVRELGIQAIPVNGWWTERINHFNLAIPPIPDFYERLSVGDYKHAVKIPMSRRTLHEILIFAGS